MDPVQTFLDDPLRVLRTIRFATRFNFEIVDEIHQAILSEETGTKIKNALAVKVTFERIGREVDQMLEGSNPELSIKYLYDYHIFSHVLKFPKECAELQDVQKVDELTYGTLKICEILGRLFKSIKSNSGFLSIHWPKEEELNEIQRNTFYSGILVPFRSYEYTIKKGQKPKTESVVAYVMYESLKQPNKAKNFAVNCLANLDSFLSLANKEEFDSIEVGTLVKTLGEQLEPTFLLAIATEYFSEHLNGTSEDIDIVVLDEYCAKYERFYQKMKEHKIDKAHHIVPLMNGKDVMKLYDIKGGEILKKLLDEVFKWQLQYPEGTKEELEKFMLENKEEFLN